MKSKFILLTLILLLLGLNSYGQKTVKIPLNKQAVIQSVDAHQVELIVLSNQVWGFAETALKEYKSSKVLADYVEAQGFKVERGVAGMPTAFVANYGTGKPIIAVLGEYDALPGLSQKAVPYEESLAEGAPGHGCGHNLLGVGGLGAALAIKELIQQGKLKGTIRFYGTPAEEDKSGKSYMVREGLFNDVDVCLDWHPGMEVKANVQSSTAVIDFTVEFFGKTAHAAADPWNGRSAVDGMQLFDMGINTYREHIRPTTRIHNVIQAGGDVPNVIPKYAKIWVWIRDPSRAIVQETYARVQQIAKGAALMADVDYKVTLNSGLHEVLVNRTGGKALYDNLLTLGPITYTEEEITFAKNIQQALGKNQTGLKGEVAPFDEKSDKPASSSTDVGDVSWVVPEIRLGATTRPDGSNGHSWAVVACGGMSIGHKGMLYAAKALAMTMVDLFENETLRKEIRVDFERQKGDYVFKAMLPEGPPPIPKEEPKN